MANSNYPTGFHLIEERNQILGNILPTTDILWTTFWPKRSVLNSQDVEISVGVRESPGISGETSIFKLNMKLTAECV